MSGRMSHFPAFLDLRGRRCLVVGATPEAARKAALLAAAGAAALVFAGRGREAARALMRLLARAHLPATGPEEGHVALIAAPDDPELLTLKALRLLQAADAIVHDRAVSAAAIAYGRRDATL